MFRANAAVPKDRSDREWHGKLCFLRGSGLIVDKADHHHLSHIAGHSRHLIGAEPVLAHETARKFSAGMGRRADRELFEQDARFLEPPDLAQVIDLAPVGFAVIEQVEIAAALFEPDPGTREPAPDGGRGMFPANFVELIGSCLKLSNSTMFSLRYTGFSASSTGASESDVAVGAATVATTEDQGICARALYDYQAGTCT